MSDRLTGIVVFLGISFFITRPTGDPHPQSTKSQPPPKHGRFHWPPPPPQLHPDSHFDSALYQSNCEQFPEPKECESNRRLAQLHQCEKDSNLHQPKLVSPAAAAAAP